MNNYPQPSTPPLEPTLQFQYITYPQTLAQPKYPDTISYFYSSNIQPETRKEKKTCFTYLATGIALICCCFISDENENI